MLLLLWCVDIQSPVKPKLKSNVRVDEGNTSVGKKENNIEEKRKRKAKTPEFSIKSIACNKNPCMLHYDPNLFDGGEKLLNCSTCGNVLFIFLDFICRSSGTSFLLWNNWNR